MTNKSKLAVLALALSVSALAPMAQALTLGSLSDSTTSGRIWGPTLTIDGKLVFRSVNLSSRSSNNGSGFITLDTGGLPGKGAIRWTFNCSNGTTTNVGVAVTSNWSIPSGTINATCPTRTSVSSIKGEYKVKCSSSAGSWTSC